MEYTLILLKDGRNILVSDEKPKTEGEKCFSFYVKEVTMFGLPHTTQCNKIIAGIDNIPTLSYSDLVKQKLREEFGWVDVELLAIDSCEPRQIEFIGVSESDIESFIKGFKAHQSVVKERFSLKDMYGLKDLLQKTSPLMFESATRGYIKSLQQPIQLKVEIEIEYKDGFGNWYLYDIPVKNFEPLALRPKITNNSILITKILNNDN